MATSKLQLPGGLKTVNQVPADAKYFSITDAPFISTAEAISQILTGARHIGLTVNVAGVEYWWKMDLQMEI